MALWRVTKRPGVSSLSLLPPQSLLFWQLGPENIHLYESHFQNNGRVLCIAHHC